MGALMHIHAHGCTFFMHTQFHQTITTDCPLRSFQSGKNPEVVCLCLQTVRWRPLLKLLSYWRETTLTINQKNLQQEPEQSRTPTGMSFHFSRLLSLQILAKSCRLLESCSATQSFSSATNLRVVGGRYRPALFLSWTTLLSAAPLSSSTPTGLLSFRISFFEYLSDPQPAAQLATAQRVTLESLSLHFKTHQRCPTNS